ncbi:hypothetical protein R3P38DRAFT_2834697 [Favolaschia claudopus]|uniref:Uncharacterized protein n=1 Tax=Favolaschia claudopus TaxID=2862362 RepID=A0AAW0EE13_9AGAR
MAELTSRRRVMPMKSSQSGARPSPFERAIATRAAASMTHESGFHMKERNCKNGFCSSCSSLLGPKSSRRRSTSSAERPVSSHWSSLKTLSILRVPRSTFSLLYKSSALSSMVLRSTLTSVTTRSPSCAGGYDMTIGARQNHASRLFIWW